MTSSITGTSLVAAPPLSTKDFSDAIQAKNTERVKVYGKVLKKYNKRQARATKSQDPSVVKVKQPHPWNAHVKAFRASHPGMPFAEVLKAAKLTYKK